MFRSLGRNLITGIVFPLSLQPSLTLTRDLDGSGHNNMTENVEESINRGDRGESTHVSNDGCDDAFDERSYLVSHENCLPRERYSEFSSEVLIHRDEFCELHSLDRRACRVRSRTIGRSVARTSQLLLLDDKVCSLQ